MVASHRAPWLAVDPLMPRAVLIQHHAGSGRRSRPDEHRPQADHAGARQLACLQPLPRPSIWRSLDDQRAGLRTTGRDKLLEIGRGGHYRLVDLGELLFCTVTPDADGVAEVLEALRRGRIHLQGNRGDRSRRRGLDLARLSRVIPRTAALRRVSDRHASVERRQQVLLRIGETVRSAEFVRLVDVDREPARHLFSADLS